MFLETHAVAAERPPFVSSQPDAKSQQIQAENVSRVMSDLFAKNVRAAATWIGSPVALVALWVLWEWFFSTDAGVVLGLIVGLLVLIGVGLSIGFLFYMFRSDRSN
jgi:hypothetical protein